MNHWYLAFFFTLIQHMHLHYNPGMPASGFHRICHRMHLPGPIDVTLPARHHPRPEKSPPRALPVAVICSRAMKGPAAIIRHPERRDCRQ